MTVPTKAKIWNLVSKNVYESHQDITNRHTLFEIKDALVNGSGAWTVEGSCDKNNWNIGGADLWIDWEDLVWAAAGSAHSWIILKQTGIAANFQILIDCRFGNTSTEDIEILVSQNDGFIIGGSVTNRPTAADEQQIIAGDWGVSSSNAQRGVNVLKASDGTCTRVILTYNKTFLKAWFFDSPKSHASWWTDPYLAAVIEPTIANLFNAANFKTRIDGENVNVYLSGETVETRLLTDELQALFQVPDYDGEWLIMPVGVVSNSAARKGRIGECEDLWWIPSNWPTGFYMAGAGARDFVSIRDVLIAWTGSVDDRLLIM